MILDEPAHKNKRHLAGSISTRYQSYNITLQQNVRLYGELYLLLHEEKKWETMTCLHGAFSCDILEEYLEHELTKALFSKGTLSLDDEVESFHPNVPEGYTTRFMHGTKQHGHSLSITTLRHLHFDPGHLTGSASSVPMTTPENLVN